jgi:predicted nuclease of predicted toxin-antitoxin system
MKFLADESLEARLVEFLREQGHDVRFVAEMTPGLSDADVLAQANREQRILLTNDKGFGELTFLQRQARHGIIRFRFQSESITLKKDRLAQLLTAHAAALPSHFTVVTDGRVRLRHLEAMTD